MAVGIRGLLLCAMTGLTLSFAPARAADNTERYNNVAPAPEEEPAAQPEPEPTTNKQRARRGAKNQSKTDARKARNERSTKSPAQAQDAARAEDGGAAAQADQDVRSGDSMAPLTVRAVGGYGDSLSAQLTLRDMARKERRMKPVMAAPTSLRDRPAPALPGDKHEVDEVGDEPEVAAPKAPRAPDAATTREEADYLVQQTPRVIMHCFPAPLRQVLARMSKHFGSQVIVTSGFRSRGRRHSQHRYCKAADIQIAGVRPSQIVGYAQLQDEVGGIGTYRHTRSVHIDVREQKISWYGNRGRGHFRLAKDISGAASSWSSSSVVDTTSQGGEGSGGGHGGGGGPGGGGAGGGGGGAGGAR